MKSGIDPAIGIFDSRRTTRYSDRPTAVTITRPLAQIFDICNLKRTERHYEQMVHCPMLPLPRKGGAGQDDRKAWSRQNCEAQRNPPGPMCLSREQCTRGSCCDSDGASESDVDGFKSSDSC